ncbi:MAG TPA: LysM peptidoglycan-binding domain-containing protein [Acidimicrobiia bacterium]
MAVAMTTRTPGLRLGADPTTRSRRPVSTATYRRRRVAAAVAGVALVLVVAQAGGALGDSPLAVPERRPAVSSASESGLVRHVVEPGDSLWSIAERLAPGEDPRPIVDALVEARGSAALVPGETIVWPG